MNPVEPAGPPREEAARLVSLAWPVVLGQLGMFAMGLVDMILVGRLGPDAFAALGVANTWVFGTLLVGLGTASGLDPLVAQAYGAGKPREAGAAGVRGAVVLAAVGALIMVAHLAAEPALRLLAQPEELIPDAALYCRIVAPSVLPMLAFALLRQFLQGSGNMRPATVAILLGNVANAFLDWVLIFGKLGAPAMGVAGAAWATTAVRGVLVFVLIAMAWPALREARPQRAGLFDPRELARVAWVALPVGVQLATEVWAFTAASFMSGWLGTTAVAAHTAALSLASLTYMVPLGLSAAAATRVGNLVGAGLPWPRAAWTAVALAAGVMGTSAAAFTAMPRVLGRIYLPAGDALELMVVILPYAALFQLADGTQVSCFGVLRGLGDTRQPMIANLVGYWLIGLPLGVWLGFYRGWGLAGVWLGLAVGLILVAALLLGRLNWHTRRSEVAAKIM